MTNIMFKLSNLEIINKHITEEKNKFVQNLQGALEKEWKLKVELQVKKDENNEVFVKLQTTRRKINNMEKHDKDLKKIKVMRVSCWQL
jgi:hypothetical protein